MYRLQGLSLCVPRQSFVQLPVCAQLLRSVGRNPIQTRVRPVCVAATDRKHERRLLSGVLADAAMSASRKLAALEGEMVRSTVQRKPLDVNLMTQAEQEKMASKQQRRAVRLPQLLASAQARASPVFPGCCPDVPWMFPGCSLDVP
jgi:hypothetical protein